MIGKELACLMQLISLSLVVDFTILILQRCYYRAILIRYSPSIPGVYEAEVEGDIIKGPGTVDMLGGIMAMIQSVRILHT